MAVDMRIPVNCLPGRIGYADFRIRQHIPAQAIPEAPISDHHQN